MGTEIILNPQLYDGRLSQLTGKLELVESWNPYYPSSWKVAKTILIRGEIWCICKVAAGNKAERIQSRYNGQSSEVVLLAQNRAEPDGSNKVALSILTQLDVDRAILTFRSS